MKKFLEYFYLFSKLTTVLVLFLALIGIGFVFYKTYTNQNKTAKLKDTQNNNLTQQINKNYSEIKSIESKLNKSQQSIIRLIKDLEKKSSKIINQEYNSDLENSINTITQSLSELSNEILLIKKQINSNVVNLPDENYKLKNSKIDIIKIIKNKYENNFSFDDELELLQSLSPSSKKIYFEKIRIDILKKFKGYSDLELMFEEEMENFIKENLIKKSKNIFYKTVLLYVDIEPSSESITHDENVSLLIEIKKSIKEKNINKAYNKLLLINDYKTKFPNTHSEILKYIEFNKTLKELI